METVDGPSDLRIIDVRKIIKFIRHTIDNQSEEDELKFKDVRNLASAKFSADFASRTWRTWFRKQIKEYVFGPDGDATDKEATNRTEQINVEKEEHADNPEVSDDNQGNSDVEDDDQPSSVNQDNNDESQDIDVSEDEIESSANEDDRVSNEEEEEEEEEEEDLFIINNENRKHLRQ